MQKNSMKFTLIIILLLIALGGLMVLSLIAGKVNLLDVSNDVASTIFFNIRIPRVLIAVFIGMGLSVSGTIFQSLLNNPLADSYTLGISSGSAFGACLAIYFSSVYGFVLPREILAVVFGLLVLYLVIKIGSYRGGLESSSLVLSGIIIGSFFSAGLRFLKALADENVASMVYWLMGNLSSKKIQPVLIVGFVCIVGLLIAIRYGNELNILTLGRKEAQLIGVNYNFVYGLLIATASVITAFCVSLCGIISFVGLVVPHLSRMIMGADNRKVIPLSALLGAIFLLFADTVTRTLLPHELPVGILTTMIGGPFFIYIFVKRRVA